MSIYTQREHLGLYELTDVARAELMDSKYYNKDLAPTSLSQRTWTTYNVASLWIGMSICLPAYALAASLVALGMSTWMAVLNVALGNLLILIPMQLNSHAGTKYGVPYPVFARLAFGPRGAHIASIARGLVGCGWFGIYSWMGGKALHILIRSMIPSYGAHSWTQGLTCFLFLLLNLYVAYRGHDWIRKLESWGAPLLGALAAALFIWITYEAKQNGGSILSILNEPSNGGLLNSRGGALAVFAAGLTGNMAFWSTLALNIPDFSRYARSQRSQFRGQLFGLPTTMTVFALFGAYVTSATKFLTPDHHAVSDLPDVIGLTGAPSAFLIGAAGILIATLTTNIAANLVAPANGFSNLAPKKISYRAGVVITGAVTLLMRPWTLIQTENSYIYGWLGTLGIILGGLMGIFICDYYFIKRKNMDVMSLFQAEEGRYWYTAGFNLKALTAWFCGCLLPLVGKLTVLFPQLPRLEFLSDNGYIISFAISFLIYPLLMKGTTASLVNDDDMEAMTER